MFYTRLPIEAILVFVLLVLAIQKKFYLTELILIPDMFTATFEYIPNFTDVYIFLELFKRGYTFQTYATIFPKSKNE